MYTSEGERVRYTWVAIILTGMKLYACTQQWTMLLIGNKSIQGAGIQMYK